MTSVSDALRALAAEHGWEPGTHLENKVALVLSRYGSPCECKQQSGIARFPSIRTSRFA
jgi:hypothetical protein